jgi:hypothetical protein
MNVTREHFEFFNICNYEATENSRTTNSPVNLENINIYLHEDFKVPRQRSVNFVTFRSIKLNNHYFMTQLLRILWQRLKLWFSNYPILKLEEQTCVVQYSIYSPFFNAPLRLYLHTILTSMPIVLRHKSAVAKLIVLRISHCKLLNIRHIKRGSTQRLWTSKTHIIYCICIR